LEKKGGEKEERVIIFILRLRIEKIKMQRHGYLEKSDGSRGI
jgi:hypothetical protein